MVLLPTPVIRLCTMMFLPSGSTKLCVCLSITISCYLSTLSIFNCTATSGSMGNDEVVSYFFARYRRGSVFLRRCDKGGRCMGCLLYVSSVQKQVVTMSKSLIQLEIVVQPHATGREKANFLGGGGACPRSTPDCKTAVAQLPYENRGRGLYHAECIHFS